MALTDIAVGKLKPADKPFKVGDERGLDLLINPQGGKLWRWKYRYLGKEKLMALGATRMSPWPRPGRSVMRPGSCWLLAV